MIVKCEAQNRIDYFYIKDCNSLDELKDYAKNNIPIKCLELWYQSFSDVYIRDKAKEVYLYLNNYLYYTDVSNKYYLMFQKEIDDIYYTQCKKCKYRDDVLVCKYKRDGNFNQCLNFKEKFSIWMVFKK